MAVFADPQFIQFRFSGVYVRAVGHRVDSSHPNVLRLSLTRSTFGRLGAWIIQRLPATIRAYFRTVLPAYFLPQNVILKKLKPSWDDEFDNEKTMYSRLEPLQGRLIPICYGKAVYEGSRALILSVLEGVRPFYQDIDCPLDEDELDRRVESAFRQLATFGVTNGDTKLDNFLVTEQSVLLVDLESLDDVDPRDVELAVTSLRDHLMYQYKNYLKNRFSPRAKRACNSLVRIKASTNVCHIVSQIR